MKTNLRLSNLALLTLAFLLAGSATGAPTVQIGPDMVPDLGQGSGPFVISNTVGGYGYQLEIAPNPTAGWEWHVPIFTLTNTSTNPWADILSFQFTIGDTAFNFDHIGVEGVSQQLPTFTTDANGDGAYGSAVPDHVNAEVRSDYVQFLQMTGFNPGDVFVFESDIDADSAGSGVGSIEDFRQVFWDNGESLNSEITVTYPTIPAPGAFLLGSIGVSLIGWLRRRRTF